MKRRKFLLTSGTALLGSTAFQSISQEPAVALNFDLIGVENVQPSNTDTILVDFQNFELVPKYVDETAGDATITITLDIEGHDTVQNKSSISLSNGTTVIGSDLGSVIPIVQDNISSNQTSLDGSIKISIDHSDVSDTYQKGFTITDDQLLDSLTGYWPLHEWSGKANDLSGNGNHGTLIGGVTQGVSGRGGLTSYSFNGSDGAIRSTDYSRSSGGELTIAFWIRSRTTDVFPFEERINTNAATFVADNDPNGIYAQVENDGSGSSVVYGGSTFGTNEWKHVCFTVSDIQEVLSIYIDGKLEATTDFTGTITGADRIEWGGVPSANFGYVEAEMFDMRSYDRALSDTEVQMIYQLGSGSYTEESLHDGSDSGALSRYTFDGNVTTDEWSSNTLTNETSATTTTDAIHGNAKSFDGSDDRMELPNLSLSSAQSFTISAWINTDASGIEQRILSRYDGSDDIAELNIKSSDRVSINIGHTGSTLKCISPDPISKGNWYNIVGVYDSSGPTVRIFINGAEQNSTTGQVDDFSTTDGPWIGARNDSKNHFDGDIDDVRIYNRALSTDEIQELYQWGTRGQDLRERTTTNNKNDMLGWWKLNETNGSTAYDSSGNNDDGNVINGGDSTILGSDTDPRGSSSYVFDGSNDYVDVPSQGTLSSYSVSLWAKLNSSPSVEPLYIDQQDNRIRIRASNSDQIQFLQNGNGPTITGISTNQWYHLTQTWNGNTLKAYIDSEIRGSDSKTTMETNNDGTFIGGSSEYGRYSDASVSDVRLYDRALTPQEVSYLYEQKF